MKKQMRFMNGSHSFQRLISFLLASVLCMISFFSFCPELSSVYVKGADYVDGTIGDITYYYGGGSNLYLGGKGPLNFRIKNQYDKDNFSWTQYEYFTLCPDISAIGDQAFMDLNEAKKFLYRRLYSQSASRHLKTVPPYKQSKSRRA